MLTAEFNTTKGRLKGELLKVNFHTVLVKLRGFKKTRIIKRHKIKHQVLIQGDVI